MFINDLKLVVSQEILKSADLLKAGSPQGYDYLRAALGHALFFAPEDKEIFYLQHLLGPMRQEVILAIADFDKNTLIEIGKKLTILGKALGEDKGEAEIFNQATEIGLLIERTWRKIIQSPIGPRVRLGIQM